MTLLGPVLNQNVEEKFIVSCFMSLFWVLLALLCQAPKDLLSLTSPRVSHDDHLAQISFPSV